MRADLPAETQVQLPPRFRRILGKRPKLEGDVLRTFGEFAPWLGQNRLVFFPEYTDHGLRHIQEVLCSAEAIISDPSYEVLTPEDVAVLALATLLHDLALHLREDGFLDLVSEDHVCFAGHDVFNERPWHVLWEDFIREAKRFDARTLTRIFGEPAPVSRPEPDPLHWDDKDRRLIGEFLRRHHHRLAHEIALGGVPGPAPSSERLRVVAEVYGRFPRLNTLGLVIRRIRSNLDDDHAFATAADFVPRLARFEAASGDLLPLLIEPLYGDRPEIGIRELVQNAVDAVREREDYRLHSAIGMAPLEADDGPAVTVKLEKDAKGISRLIVTDRGIGMTPEIVAEFFLKVGASFRHSDAWRKNFEDESGHSRVLRSGRFGVGVLAAFLLGEEIQVVTRHVDSADEGGVQFTATMDSDLIEMRKTRCSVGTTVRVKLRDDVVARLTKRHTASWDWYCLAYPTVKRVSLGQTVLRQARSFPAADAELPPGWHRIQDARFRDIQWRYDGRKALVINGIRIGSSDFQYRRHERIYVGDMFSINEPTLSTFDPDGNMPLNLQRDSLARNKLPFHESLLRAVVRDIVAFALSAAPSAVPWIGDGFRDWRYIKYPGLEPRSSWEPKFLPWVFGGGGFALADPEIVEMVSPKKVYVLPFLGEITTDMTSVPPDALVLFSEMDITQTSIVSWVRGIIEDHTSLRKLLGGVSGFRILLTEEWAARLSSGPKHVRLPRYMQSMIEAASIGRWVLWSSTTSPEPGVDFEKLVQREEDRRNGSGLPVLVAELYMPGPPSRPRMAGASPGGIASAWVETLGSAAFLPYSKAERRARFAGAFRALREYIDSHLQQAR